MVIYRASRSCMSNLLLLWKGVIKDGILHPKDQSQLRTHPPHTYIKVDKTNMKRVTGRSVAGKGAWGVMGPFHIKLLSSMHGTWFMDGDGDDGPKD